MKQTLEQAAIEAVENHYGMDYDGKMHEMYILRESLRSWCRLAKETITLDKYKRGKTGTEQGCTR